VWYEWKGQREIAKEAKGKSMRKDERDAIERTLARHTARLLTNLEDARCPDIYHKAVKDELTWLKSDMKEITQPKENENENSNDQA
jgi:hypothetical protein